MIGCGLWLRVAEPSLVLVAVADVGVGIGGIGVGGAVATILSAIIAILAIISASGCVLGRRL